jgi:hypothetical protein
LNQRGALGDIHAAVCLMRLAPEDQAISKVPSRGARLGFQIAMRRAWGFRP